MMNESGGNINSRVDEIVMELEDLCLSSFRAPVENISVVNFHDFPAEASTIDEPAFSDWRDMAGYKDVIMENRIDVLVIGKWTHMFVSEVHSPHKFFFQTEMEQPEFLELMNNLRIFYCDQFSDTLKPRVQDIQCNLLVAATYDDVWHRGRIISAPFLEEMKLVVKIYYVDFGTVENVPLENIRFLHRSFLKTPQLCHRASLCGTLPSDNVWTPKVATRFLAHVKNRHLMALAHFFYAPDRSWHVELVDPERMPLGNINLQLIRENFARNNKNDDLEEYVAYYKEHPPSFDALVNGQFPTYPELLEYEQAGL